MTLLNTVLINGIFDCILSTLHFGPDYLSIFLDGLLGKHISHRIIWNWTYQLPIMLRNWTLMTGSQCQLDSQCPDHFINQSMHSKDGRINVNQWSTESEFTTFLESNRNLIWWLYFKISQLGFFCQILLPKLSWKWGKKQDWSPSSPAGPEQGGKNSQLWWIWFGAFLTVLWALA